MLTNSDPKSIRENFAQMLPDQFTTDDTLILQFPFHDDLVMLGVLNVDRAGDKFEFYALNQAGIAYFHLAGFHGNVFIRDAIGPWMDHKDILLSIGLDIERVYFHLSPDTGRVEIKPTEIVFQEKTDGGNVTYQFGMEPTVLMQKQLDGFFGPAWRARYYDYRPAPGGKLFPRGIVMDNSQFHYRLIVKNRDWSVDENQ